MAYDSQQNYAKYQALKKKCLEESAGGEPCSGCSENSETNCGCCPPGLVAVEDENGKVISCLTPNDAQEWYTNNLKCQPGFVKLYRNETTEFLGCVPSDEFEALYAAVNPTP